MQNPTPAPTGDENPALTEAVAKDSGLTGRMVSRLVNEDGDMDVSVFYADKLPDSITCSVVTDYNVGKVWWVVDRASLNEDPEGVLQQLAGHVGRAEAEDDLRALLEEFVANR